MKITRVKEVHFLAEQVNGVYVLPKDDMVDFQAKGYELGTLMDRILWPNQEVSWVVTQRGISMYNFTVEARILLNIIWKRVSSCTYKTFFTDLWACMVAYLMYGISLIVGQFMLK